MDALITVAIVAAAALWSLSRLFRRAPSSGSGGCASGCDGCPLAGHGAQGGCGATRAKSSRGTGSPLRSPGDPGR